MRVHATAGGRCHGGYIELSLLFRTKVWFCFQCLKSSFLKSIAQKLIVTLSSNVATK